MSFYKLDRVSGTVVPATPDDPDRVLTKAEIEQKLSDRLFAGTFIGLALGLILQRIVQKSKGKR